MVIVDDHVDDPNVSRNSQLLHNLFTRGRHSQISTLVSTQQFAALSQLIRVNAESLYVFRLRNNKYLAICLEDISAIVDKNTLLKKYKRATDESVGFLFVQLNASDKQNMCLINFDSYIEIADDDEYINFKYSYIYMFVLVK